MRHARTLLSAFAVLLLLAACSTQTGELFDQAIEVSTIDFEGLDEGTVVDEVSAGMGISGFDAGGFVDVHGTNPGGNIPGSEGGGVYAGFGAENAAIVFDANSTPHSATSW
jgi:Ethanolamine utilization protein EutJ (predicted chaperonin)